MPVQFLFAGKAHPADKAGQELIKRIVEVSLMPEFIGKIVFIPGYDMTIARKMVQGVDIWMNTPTRPLEASGTSGEKAVMNGVMHFSVLDGWWVEGYKEGAGWALPMNNTYSDTEFQDELDAATIYNMLENDIAPVFYNIDSNGLSSEWIEIIKNTIAHVAANFTTNRMLNDYQVQYYEPMSVRHHNIVQNDYALARELAFWKKKVRREWPLIEVRSYSKLDNAKSEMVLGNDYTAEVELYLGELSPEDIGVEILIAEQNNDNRMVIKERFDFVPVSIENSVAKYTCNIKPETAGLYNVAARIYPKNPHLPHRQDFDLVKWL
ncbi:Glycogen phosphorylase [bioreactor metagenome]|uniref:Glycogen phosphorylase n=1 Tax=bioreactor metagenome TaxID=1076179 RepID=A0A645D2J3_9ZZZZ